MSLPSNHHHRVRIKRGFLGPDREKTNAWNGRISARVFITPVCLISLIVHEWNELGIGANPIYSSEAWPAFSQLSLTQPTAAAAVILFTGIMLMVLVLKFTSWTCLFLSALLDEMDGSSGGDGDRWGAQINSSSWFSGFYELFNKLNNIEKQKTLPPHAPKFLITGGEIIHAAQDGNVHPSPNYVRSLIQKWYFSIAYSVYIV